MNDILYKSHGMLHYSGINRLVVNVEQDLADYYRSLIPRWIPNNRGRYRAHITVIREVKEKIEPEFIQFWGKYEGEIINFFYNPIIQQDDNYFWLDVYSQRLEEIRKELGLWVVARFTIPPPPFVKTWHFTIANRKT